MDDKEKIGSSIKRMREDISAFKRLPIRSELINIHHVMVEVKKHKSTF